MTLPGVRLRRVLARWCAEKTVRQRIDPAIADLQSEYREAARHGHRWLALWIWLAGHLALVTVLAVCLCEAAAALWEEMGSGWNRDDRRTLARIVASAVPVLVAATVLLNLPFSQFVTDDPDSSRAAMVVYLVPHALTLAVPVALLVAIGVAVPSAVSRQLVAAVIAIASVCSIVSFLNAGWLTPAANQAFRLEVSGDPGLAKGDNELTLLEARSGLKSRYPDPVDATRLAVRYYQRWALACAPVVLTLFALALPARPPRRRAAAALSGSAAFLAYYFPVPGDLPDLIGWMPPVLIAWLPNLLFGLAAARNHLTSRPANPAAAH
jgi:hypothetical protein